VVTTTLSAPVVCGNSAARSSGYVPLGTASALLGVSDSTCRRLIDDGQLAATVLPSGHRRVSRGAIAQFLGEASSEWQEEEQETGLIPVALVARVSGNGQSKGLSKGSRNNDLARQQDRLAAFAKERWDKTANVTMYSRTASGLNYEHEVFVRLCGDILSGMYRGGFIVATTKDRICRFGLQMFRLICEKGGAELVFCGKGEAEKGEYESLADDVIAIMTHFSAKTHGKRAAESLRKRVSDECLSRIKILKDKGWCVSAVCRQLKKEGFKAFNKVGHVEAPSFYVVNGIFETLHLSEGYGGKDSPSCIDFLKRIKRGTSQDRISTGMLWAAYVKQCQEKGIRPQPKRVLGKKIAKRLRGSTTINHSGKTVWVGWKLAE
jgi:excisionase family DNA binding protein